MSVTILTENELQRCVTMDAEALQAIEQAFVRLSSGQTSLPLPLHLSIPDHHGEVDVKTAYLFGEEDYAVKIASGFLENNRYGLPTGNGMMVLFSALTGMPLALLLDNGYLTDVRTGLAGAIAAKYLARPEIETVGVIGSGIQSRFQTRALHLVRNFKRLLVYGNHTPSVHKFMQEMEDELQIEVHAADDYEQVVRNSDVLITTTPSASPYLRSEWLHPGLHITCMGSDSPHKQEINADVFARVDAIFADRSTQCLRIGELHHALTAGVISDSTEIVELGEVIAGQKSGRQSDEQITICDLTGVGVQDSAIAHLAYQKSKQLHFGTDFE